MKKNIFIIIFIIISFPLYSLDISEFYYDADIFMGGKIDPNLGLTTFPILRIPIGGKYEAMGTAFTAVADDASFIEANPAASSRLKNTELAFFHTDWIADTNIESIMYTSRINNFGYGVGLKFLYVPFTEYDLWGSRQSRGYYSESVFMLNGSYTFFSSYDFYGISLGSNIKIAYRNVPSNIYPDQSAYSIMTDFGAITKINFLKFYSSRDKNTSFGVALKNLGFKALDEPLPLELTTGIAYSPMRPVVLALDIIFPLSLEKTEQPAELWGYAFGTNVLITEFFSVQSGFRYRGSNPRFTLGSRLDLEDISFNLNYTLDLATQTGLDRFSVVTSLNLGDKGRSDSINNVDFFYTEGLIFYSEGDLINAIYSWQEALEIDPGFTPALSSIAVAEKTLQLLEEMKNIQLIN